MKVLEKILEEIENHAIEFESFGMCDDYVSVGWVKEIIRKHMDDATDTNDGWILVEDGLPEEHDSIFAKFKGTDMWNNAMFEKVSDEVNVTIELEDGTRKTTTSHTLDGKWKVEKECVVNKKVIAWRPLPKPYKPENRNNNTTKEYQQEVEHLLEEIKSENGYVRVSDLAKRFEKIDHELFKDSSWNLLQILSNINILVPEHFD